MHDMSSCHMLVRMQAVTRAAHPAMQRLQTSTLPQDTSVGVFKL